MSTKIGSHIQSLGIIRDMENSSKKVGESYQRMSSGNRIATSKDDAAGLSIAKKLEASVRSKAQSIRNANDAISMLQVGEGTLTEVSNMLVRLRELAVQASSDTTDDDGRLNLEKEVSHLKREITRITQGVEIFGNKLFTGEDKSMDFMVGANGGGAESDMISFNTKGMSTNLYALGIFDVSLRTKIKSLKSLQRIDYAIGDIANTRSLLGSMATRLESSARNSETTMINLDHGKSRITDADMALESSKAIRNKLKNQLSTGALKEDLAQRGKLNKLID